MRTQYEKNSVYIAGINYRLTQKRARLRRELILFFALLTAVCAAIFLIISTI